MERGTIMTGYSIALFIHLLSLLLACVAASLTTFASLQLRAASSSTEAMRWLALSDRIVPGFPIATLGLFATGAYMSETSLLWSAPWVLAALAGLAAIAVLGGGVEGSRVRTLKRELQNCGFSERARRLLCDPVAWTAKLMTLTLALGVTFVMTIKPSAEGASVTLLLALATGLFGAVPLWWRGSPISAASESITPSGGAVR
jgi:hypothetical protein